MPSPSLSLFFMMTEGLELFILVFPVGGLMPAPVVLALISLISLNAIYNGIMNYEIPVNAQSISDLEEVKRENSKKISQLQEAVQAANAKLNKSDWFS